MAVVTRVKQIRHGKSGPFRKVREIVCNAWADLEKALDSLTIDRNFLPDSSSRWIFRGQADALWPLENSLRRQFLDKGRNWAKAKSPQWNSAMAIRRIEGQLALDFAAKATMYGVSLSVERPVELLSAMRHFRTPTRLLDWTYSPYIALYFAFEETSSCDQAAVWAINLSALHRTSTLRVLPVTRSESGKKLRPPIRIVDFGDDRNFKKYVLPDLEEYHRTLLFGEPALDIVVPILPRTHNERLSAQQGLFLCPSKVGRSLYGPD
jgi:hypothetical protein